MSFRLKTVLGIAAIEGFLLLVLVWSSSTTLVDTTLEELSKRGETALGKRLLGPPAGIQFGDIE